MKKFLRAFVLMLTFTAAVQGMASAEKGISIPMEPVGGGDGGVRPPIG